LNKFAQVLAFGSILEIGTGLVLMVDPGTVSMLLLGAQISGIATLLGRFFGVTLLSLGVACWPWGRGSVPAGTSFLGMLIYNVLVAAYLTYLGVSTYMGGVMLWPAVVLHAAVALVLVWASHDETSPTEKGKG